MATKKATQKLRSGMGKKHGKGRFWKVVQAFEGKLFSQYQDVVYRPGVVKSGSNAYDPFCSVESTGIKEGIHAFLARKDAEADMEDSETNWGYKDLVILPVRAKKEHLIAAGVFEAPSVPAVRSAVFSQVEVRKGDYNRIVQ